MDQKNLGESNFSAIRGHWASNIPRLFPRLAQVGLWIAKVSSQPTAVWWAAHQNKLHPDIQRQIRWELQRPNREVPSVIQRAWQYLFEAWEQKERDFDLDLYELKAAIAEQGWSGTVLRQYLIIKRPYLKAGPNLWTRLKRLKWSEELNVEDILSLNVEYPSQREEIPVPDELLEFFVGELRKNLEHSLRLETELGGYLLNDISPIIPDDRPDDNHYRRANGLSGSVIEYSSLFERLAELNVNAAIREFNTWLIDDETIFSRLRIWASGISELVPANLFRSIIASLSDNAFWSGYHQRDLLLVLAKRWDELNEDARKEIEGRLLKGPARWNDEKDDEFERNRSASSLNRITWMANNGCAFTFDLESETKKLRNKAGSWKPEYAAKAAESRDGRGGWVRTETQYSSLLGEALGSILSKAVTFSGRREDFLVEKDPFAGLWRA